MFKILSLDGGGIRGAFTASLLAKIQESLDRPLASYFDLIVGTSTGGLIAVALGMGLSADEIKALYENEGASIFTRRPVAPLGWKRRAIDAFLWRMAPKFDAEWLFASKYTSDRLITSLTATLGERTLEQSQCRLAIPAVDLVAGKVIVFKTPHRPRFVRDRRFKAVDIIAATTAAPSYFPTATIEPGSAYCDGGIWANNPALVGYVEAIKIQKECRRQELDLCFSPNDIHLLSIGTGRAAYFMEPQAAAPGLLWWGSRLLNVSGEAQSEGIHWQMKYLLDDRYMRIDFDIPSEGNWDLDGVDRIGALLHIGSERATEWLPRVRDCFFAKAASRYVPFDD